MIKLNFKTLTPVHISNGIELANNLDYVVVDKCLAKLNDKAIARIAEKNIFDFSEDISYRKVASLIEKNKDIFDDDCFEYKIELMENFEVFYGNEKADGKKIVREFINSNGKFYVPGSSIKGMLSTILHRDPDKKPLGINPKDAKIEDKFVITDSEFIGSEYIVVDRAERPPAINLQTIDYGVEFSSTIRKSGNLNLGELKRKLKSYSLNQLEKANKFVEGMKNFCDTKGFNAYKTIIEGMIENFNFDDFLEKDEYLVNLGFGGGLYFKIFEDENVKQFESKKARKKLEPHTTFYVLDEDNCGMQLGWCKLKIEEI